jgi:hypothetical protein
VESVDPLDTAVPSAARMYDYYLGGGHNFPADRAAATEVMRLRPAAPLIAQANRAFLNRSVRFLLDQGIRQFLDIGSGIPNAGNVHEVAQAADPGARVVYVDNDPVAVAYSEALLNGNGNGNAAIVEADLRRPAEVLAAPEVQRLLDFSRPIGLLLVAVLNFVSDDEGPAGIMTTLREAMPTGSYLAVTHGALEVPAAGRASTNADVERVYKATRDPVTLRDRGGVLSLLAGWELVDPGLVWMVEWRPEWSEGADVDPSWCLGWGAVGRKLA